MTTIPGPSNFQQDCPEQPPIRPAIIAGFLLIIMFFGGFWAWASTAPLQSAAVAPGSVNLDTYRKTVQHLEGGIVRDILVREGQEVAKDDVLIRLDDTQASAKIQLLKAQILSEEKQLAFLAEEIGVLETLLEKGLTSRPRILALKRLQAEVEGNRAQHTAELRAAEDIVERSRILAPLTGRVVGLQVHTSGGVVKPGDPLLSIVPTDEPLVVEARVDPNDIDVIHKGLPAQVRLTPLNARMVPPIPGQVVWISADRMGDQQKGEGYYLARIQLTADESELPTDVKLYPGMPAEVMILTGERTVLNYLIAPISRSFRRAFREN